MPILLVLLSLIGVSARAQESSVCMGDQMRATVERVIDGDTVYLNPMLVGAFNSSAGVYRLTYVGSVRLLSINAPELRDPGGPEARDHLRKLVPEGSAVCVRGTRSDHFARPLVTIYLPAPEGGVINVNEAMVAAGHAVRYP